MSCSLDLIATPDFIRLPSVETLNLEGCESLEDVHMSIGSLARLVSLNLKGCKKLRSLPDTICDLRALKVLHISRCNSLETLPLQLGNIKSLTKLNADELSVSKLPESIGDLNKLVELDLSSNEMFETLPDTICNLRALEVLNISRCNCLEALPDSIGNLTKLLELDLSSSEKLETLPDSMCNLRSLETLSIKRCEKLQALPDELWKITSLRKLDASGVQLLKKLPDIGSGQIALSLDLSYSGIIALPSGFSQLSNLQSLYLIRCYDLLSIPKLPPNLKPTFVSSSTPTKYDVFLSFCGEDNQLNFTSHLYRRLTSGRIRTFMDEPGLRGGDVIPDALTQAIRESKTYIVVFSQNYASSPWRLNELVEILNCQKTAQRLVIPVFYKIDPSVVQHQTGSFKKAFKEHKKRCETEKLENWQLTLEEVAGFSGHHVSKDRSEADVINEIVDELTLKIYSNTMLLTEFAVGLYSRVKAITTLLSSDTKGVIKFGIYGMGGVGKTTLAKAVFNQLVEGGSFKGSCFLSNVSQASGTFKGLESFQQQLINDVLRCTTKVKVHNVDQGIKLIEDRICSTKVVVVVDDLDDLNHLPLLVGPFAPGSVVIITTRDREILNKTEVETSYQYLMNTLDNADSLALFMQYAFRNAEPSDTFMELSKDISHLAKGIPLALVIFGSHLFNRSEVEWKYFIEKLKRDPNSDIQQSLMH